MTKEPIKILLVDDEVQFVDTLKDRLYLRGFEAAVAYSGEEGLQKVKKNPPDVIVLDLRMPGIDGFEVLRAVKKTNPDVQVIILTGHGGDAEEASAIRMGAYSFLRKPMDIDDLLGCIRLAYRDRVEKPYVAAAMAEGGDFDTAREVMREKDLLKDFFGRQASLTVSGQLEAEALAMGLGRVYTFGPTFRAENSNTPRHVAEFWMVEPEMAFADLGDIMDLGEELVQSVVDGLLTSSAEDLRLFDRFVEPGLLDRLKKLTASPFARVSYGEAVEILERSGREFLFPVTYGVDLQTEHERYLAEEHFGRPTIVTDYPMSIKAFYMRVNDDGETVAAMDMLVPRIGELIGGSQREERLDVLKNRMLALGQQMSDYSWYLDLREFGTTPHAGFGLGFERLIMMLTGIANIRDVLPFPRTPGSIEF